MVNLTYFTPTFNRQKELKNLYSSLLNQDNKNFIWLIVDDGSTDETQEVVKQFIQDNKIEIDYHYKSNGGKHTAIDYANSICKTDYICCIDSDDLLEKNATDVILQNIKKIDKNNEIVGLIGRRKFINNIIVEKDAKWPEGGQKIFFEELSTKYKFNFDTVIVFKTNIIKNYHFPKIEDERFVTEIVFYRKFFDQYKLLTFDELIYIGEYQNDGYSAQGMNLFFKNPKGFLYFLKQSAYFAIRDRKPLRNRISAVGKYFAWKKFMKLREYKIEEYRLSPLYCLLGYIFFPRYYIIYKREYKDRSKLRIIK